MVQGVPIDDDGCIVNTNPATGEVISQIPCTTAEELDQIISRAKNAQPPWAFQTTLDERISSLKKGLEQVAKKSDQFERLIVNEMGKPMAQAKEEMEDAVDKDEFLQILHDSLKPQTFGSSTVVRHPLGVVAVLSPWNFPVDEILLLALPSLASGNTVIVKPSEVVPETGALLVETLQSVLPKGVIQLVQGDGSVGAPLVSHKDVAMIAMTGSSSTGQNILQQVAPHMKRFVLELGGKDPMIVLEDADLDKAAKDAVEYSLYNSGQVCCSIERIYVAESIYQNFQDLSKKYALNYKVGNGMDSNSNVGPLVSAMQRDRVKDQVQDAIQKGAVLLHQSTVPPGASQNDKTSFYPITVLADVTDEMKVFSEETFGPVVAMTKFDGSDEEAIRLANHTEYGLGSAVYTTDLEKAQRIAQRIDAGQVGINCYCLANMDVHCPWYVV